MQADTHADKAGLSESCAMLLGEKIDEQWNVKEVFSQKMRRMTLKQILQSHRKNY